MFGANGHVFLVTDCFCLLITLAKSKHTAVRSDQGDVDVALVLRLLIHPFTHHLSQRYWVTALFG